MWIIHIEITFRVEGGVNFIMGDAKMVCARFGSSGFQLPEQS